MQKYQGMSQCARTILLACLCVAVSHEALLGAEARPNIVIILADDLGYGDLACYGHPRFRTPNLDRMAREGVLLTDFYAPVPFCAPSRASLLTGRYPHHHHVLMNPFPTLGIDDIGIPAGEETLGEALQKVGYVTAHIGKWHLGHRPNFYPTRNGFDEYFGILYSNDMRPVQLMEGEEVAEYPVYQATLTRRYTERSLDFIERHRDVPFLLYLAHAMPHKPLAASEDFYKKSGSGLYGDVISELDWSVGEILRRLHELGLDEKTLVIFTSDNGPWYGGSTGGLRGMKNQTWEGGIRVPLIARWPSRIPAGTVSHEPAALIDIMPTVLGVCRVADKQQPAMDGRSILPTLTGRGDLEQRPLFFMKGATHGPPAVSAVRLGKWKLHLRVPAEIHRGPDFVDPWAPDGVTVIAPLEQPLTESHPGVTTGDAAVRLMLFDLSSDPSEQHNVAALNPLVVRELQKISERIKKEIALESYTD